MLRVAMQDLRSTAAFRYLLQHGVPGPTWGDREFLPTARRPGRTSEGGGIATTNTARGVRLVLVGFRVVDDGAAHAIKITAKYNITAKC